MRSVRAGSPEMMENIHALNRSNPPTLYIVDGNTYAELTPQLGDLLALVFPDYSWTTRTALPEVPKEGF